MKVDWKLTLLELAFVGEVKVPIMAGCLAARKWARAYAENFELLMFGTCVCVCARVCSYSGCFIWFCLLGP